MGSTTPPIRSLRVPGHVVQRVASVVRWVAPYVLAGAVAAVGFGTRWLESRASREDVGAEVGNALNIAKAAQASAHHAASLADNHAAELAALWAHVISLRAELMVQRSYQRQDVQTRARYTDEAQRFYAREFELQLSTHRHDPAEAARLALLAQWRPDR